MSERDGIQEKAASEGEVMPARTKRSMFAASGLGALLLVAGASVGYTAFGRVGELAAELRDEAAAESPEGEQAPENAGEKPTSFQDRPDAVDPGRVFGWDAQEPGQEAGDAENPEVDFECAHGWNSRAGLAISRGFSGVFVIPIWVLIQRLTRVVSEQS